MVHNTSLDAALTCFLSSADASRCLVGGSVCLVLVYSSTSTAVVDLRCCCARYLVLRMNVLSVYY